MKTIINTTFLFITLCFTSIAQEANDVNWGENPQECKDNLNIMQLYYKSKAYEDAASSFRKCLDKCPESSKNIYIIGEKIMKHFIKKYKEDEMLKDKMVDSLIMLYDLRMKNFAGDKKSTMKILESKGIALAKYRLKESMDEAYQLLDSAVNFTFPKTKANTAKIFMYVTKNMAINNKLTCSEVIENYVKTDKIVMTNSKIKSYKSLKKKSLEYASKCLNCDSLDSFYATNFDIMQNDTNWLNAGISLLYDQKKCTSSEILVKMMEKQFENSPAAKTAFILALYFGRKQENDKALDYFDRSLKLFKKI